MNEKKKIAKGGYTTNQMIVNHDVIPLTDELPQSLKILDLRGNPCTDMPDYRYSETPYRVSHSKISLGINGNHRWHLHYVIINSEIKAPFYKYWSMIFY